MSKICDIDGVRGGDTDFAVQLAKENGRMVVRAVNEGGFSCTDIDLIDLVEWLHSLSPLGVDINAVTIALSAFATRSSSK